MIVPRQLQYTGWTAFASTTYLSVTHTEGGVYRARLVCAMPAGGYVTVTYGDANTAWSIRWPSDTPLEWIAVAYTDPISIQVQSGTAAGTYSAFLTLERIA